MLLLCDHMVVHRCYMLLLCYHMVVHRCYMLLLFDRGCFRVEDFTVFHVWCYTSVFQWKSSLYFTSGVTRVFSSKVAVVFHLVGMCKDLSQVIVPLRLEALFLLRVKLVMS